MGVALCVTAGIACGGDSEVERRIPAPGTFVYTVGVDLWIQDERGSRLLIAAEPEHQLMQPALSPDGSQVAYVSLSLTLDDSGAIGTDLLVADLTNPQPRILFEHDGTEFVWTPRWMPDAESLIVTHEPGGMQIRVVEIALDSPERRLLRDDARDADVSPDGEHLVLIDAPYSGDPSLVVRNLRDGSERALDPAREWQPRPYRIPRFTADGRSIVFSAGQYLPQVSARALASTLNGPEDIWLFDLDRSELRPVAALGEDQPDFTLSDDGRHVLVMGAFGIYLVALDGSDPAYAIAPGEFHGSVDWRGVVSDADWAQVRESIVEMTAGSP